jgi:flagellar biosynthesis protein
MGYKRFKISQKANTVEKPLVAAALQYDLEQDDAPKVIARGQRKIAEQILAEARKHNIPIHEDPDLVTALAGVNLGEEIPVELYHVVAEVLAYIYRVTDKYSK